MKKRNLFAVSAAWLLIASACGSHTGNYHDMGYAPTPQYEPFPQPLSTGEGYAQIVENPFADPLQTPFSTFAIDVDAASYANVRRFLQNSELPPVDAIRTEELVNYFDYDYPQPAADHPFSVSTEVASCPWNPAHQLVHIGLQGREVPKENIPASNLVFLVDVSGSMDDPQKLPLVKASLSLLTEELRPQDRVAIVVYAGAAGLVLPSTPGDQRGAILEALENLKAGGGTAGGEGIALAYATARENYIADGNNRVIIATDGDFNVGPSSDAELESLIERERKSGIFLTALGFGTGNYQDGKMQTLADKGNGNHAYIDNILEAQKVLVREFGGTLLTIAKDVKLQVEFNPAQVKAYRLIGYENRLLAAQDFNDDRKDAGEMGSGHSVTALYEIIPANSPENVGTLDPSRYQPTPSAQAAAPAPDELLQVKIRYKQPDGDESKLLTQVQPTTSGSFANASENFRWSAAVAEFSQLLRQSDYAAEANYDQVLGLAQDALGTDPDGLRHEFLDLVKRAQMLDHRAPVAQR